MTLGEWLRRAGMSMRTFGRIANCSGPMISMVVNGKAKPGLALAVRIEMITDGAVPVRAWVQDEPPQDK